LMCADTGGIEDGPDRIVIDAQFFENPFPHTALGPIVETIEDALPRPKSLRQIPPRAARLGAIQHRVDEQPVVSDRTRAQFRKNLPQVLPLLVGQSMSMHRQLRSQLRSADKTGGLFRDSP
jgi:hypothetical protein